MTASGWQGVQTVDPKGSMIRLGGLTISRRDYFDPAGSYVVTGDTFAVQKELLACGGTWDSREQTWTISSIASRQTAQLLQKLSSSAFLAQSNCLAPSRAWAVVADCQRPTNGS